MLAAFLSIDSARIERFFASLVPPEYAPAYATLKAGFGVGLAGVVRGQVMICLTNGALTFLGLWLLDVKLPLLLASVATVFSLIPIFGSILSTLPIVAMALTDGFSKGFLALLWIIGIHLVEANFLNPKIMGDAARIHPVVVVFVLVLGESAAGLIGALFAVPIAAVCVTLFKYLHRRALDAEENAEAPGGGPRPADADR
jgi:predicted PurR-regulated permease PerM